MCSAQKRDNINFITRACMLATLVSVNTWYDRSIRRIISALNVFTSASLLCMKHFNDTAGTASSSLPFSFTRFNFILPVFYRNCHSPACSQSIDWIINIEIIIWHICAPLHVSAKWSRRAGGSDGGRTSTDLIAVIYLLLKFLYCLFHWLRLAPRD